MPGDHTASFALGVLRPRRPHRHRHRRRHHHRRRIAFADVLLMLFGAALAIGAVVRISWDRQRPHSAPIVLATMGAATITNRDLDQSLENYFHADSLDHVSALTPEFAAYEVEEMELDAAALREAARLGLDGVVASPSEGAASTASSPAYGPKARRTLAVLRDLITDGVQVSPAEVHREYLRRNQKVRIAYVYFDASRYAQSVKVSPGEVDAYFAGNLKRYRVPEKRSLRYVAIDPADFPELMQAWRNRSSQGSPQTSDGAWTGDAKAWLPEWIARELKADAEHFDVAAARLGLVSRETPLFEYGQTLPELSHNPELSRRAFDLVSEEVTEPVDLGGRLVIARLGRVVPEHGQLLAEIHNRVERDCRLDQAQLLIEQLAHKLVLKAQVSGFRAAVAALRLPLKDGRELTMSDRLDEGVRASTLAGAFTLAAGKTSAVVPVGDDRIVFEVLSKEPANENGFAAQRGKLEAELLEQRREAAWQVYRHRLRQQLLDSGQLKVDPLAVRQVLSDYESN